MVINTHTCLLKAHNPGEVRINQKERKKKIKTVKVGMKAKPLKRRNPL